MTELAKKLKTRHLNMIALGGSLGTGMFLTTGYAVSIAGPAGALLAYFLMAVVVYFLMNSLGEMSTYDPHTGTFCKYSADYISPSFGFAMSYNYWFNWAITVATEISAAVIIMQFWYPHASVFLLSALFFFGVLFTNIFSVRIYAEIESFLSLIKIIVVLVFIFVGMLLLGYHPELVVHNWTIPGAPFHQGLFGFVTVFLFVGFSFQGTELIGVASGETQDPHLSIPKSIRLIFWRLSLFYLLTTFIIGGLFPYTMSSLSVQNNVMWSPFTLLFSKIGVTYAASLVNFVILVAVLSATNASLYSATRTLWYMASVGQTPKIFGKLNNAGTPLLALLVTALIGSLVFLSSFVGNGLFFTDIVQVSSLSGFIAWFGIAWSHYKFRKHYVAQGRDLRQLHFRAKWFPYATLIALVILLFIMFGQVIPWVFSHHGIIELLMIYSALIMFGMLWLGHYLFTINFRPH